MMFQGNLLPALVGALFVASAMSAFAAFMVYQNSRLQQSSHAVAVVICMVIAILFGFGAVWAMLGEPG